MIQYQGRTAPLWELVGKISVNKATSDHIMKALKSYSMNPHTFIVRRGK